MALVIASCPRCGVIAERDKWSPAAIAGSLHEHQPVRVVGVMTRAEWRRTPREDKRCTLNFGGHYERAVLHSDSDGATILIPVEVR